MVLYRRDQNCAPRMRISKPDLTVVGVTSMTTAPDHSRIAAIEQLESCQRISFWDSNMGAAHPPIACAVQVGHSVLQQNDVGTELPTSYHLTPAAQVQCSLAHGIWVLAGPALGRCLVPRLPVHCWIHHPSRSQHRGKGGGDPQTWTGHWFLEVVLVLLATRQFTCVLS